MPNTVYVLNSTQTLRPYLTEGLECFISESVRDIEDLLIEFPGTVVSAPKSLNDDELKTYLFATGAEKITQIKDGKRTSQPLVERYLALYPYNHALNGRLALFKQTHKKKYLRDMTLCDYIVPAKITGGQNIVYGIAQHKLLENQMLYLAFSDLEEYDTWASQKPGWSPIKMSFSAIKRICKDKVGIMLNPSGNRLIMSRDMLLQVSEGQKT